MKKLLTLIVLITFLVSCKAQQQVVQDNDPLPEWLSAKIEAFTAAADGRKGEVKKYLYQEKVVYLTNFCVGCPDNLIKVYDADGNVVCQFGGIAGMATCPDFDQAVVQGVVWSSE